MRELSGNSFARRIMLGVFLAGLGTAVYVVLSPFLVSVAWAAILAYISWPGYVWLCRRLGGRFNIAALLMTLLVAVVLIVPIAWLCGIAARRVPGWRASGGRPSGAGRFSSA